MRLLKLLGVALFAIFALSAIAATAASAEKTLILPEPGNTAATQLEGISKGGRGILLTVAGHEVKCTKATNTFIFTSPNLGETHVLFEGCETVVIVKLTCTGTNDKSGNILFLGKVHYVLALRMKNATETELVAALVTLINEFEFKCGSVPIKVRGCAAALAEPLETLTSLTKDVFKEFSSGESEILEFLVEGTTGKETPCLTETNVNGGGFELSAETGTAENEKFLKNGKAVTVLLMN